MGRDYGRSSGRDYDEYKEESKDGATSFSDENNFLNGEEYRERSYDRDDDVRSYNRRSRGRWNRSSRRYNRFDRSYRRNNDRSYDRGDRRRDYDHYKEEGKDGATSFSDENNFLNGEEYRERSYDRDDDVRSYNRRSRGRWNRSSRRYNRFDRSFDRSYG